MRGSADMIHKNGEIAHEWREPPPKSAAGRGSLPAGQISGPAGQSGAAGAGVEHLAVEVHVELDCGEPAGRPVDDPAERSEAPFGRARLPRVAHVAVRAVLGLADPLARGLCGGAVGAEVIPAARCLTGKPGAGDPVVA